MKAVFSILPLLLVACVGVPSPLQSISDARSAVTAAQQKISNCRCVNVNHTRLCPCRELNIAREKIRHAESLLRNNKPNAAEGTARDALKTAQNVLFRLHEYTQH